MAIQERPRSPATGPGAAGTRIPPRRGRGGPPRGRGGARSRGAGTTPMGDATGVAAADGPRGRMTAPRGRGGPPLLF